MQQTLNQQQIEAGKLSMMGDVPRELDMEATAGSILRTLSHEEIEAGEPRKMEDVRREQDIVAAVEYSIQKTLDGLQVRPGEEDDVSFTIFLAPSFVLPETQPNYYEPTVVSIGPYHRNKPHLKAMDDVKKLFLRDLLSRAEGKSLKECIEVIMPLELRARSCYMDTGSVSSLNSTDFVEMLLMDGCFILELFYKVYFQDSGSMFSGRWSRSTKWADLLKLENQIPFFVLEALFKLLLVPLLQRMDPILAGDMGSQVLLRFITVNCLQRNITECSFIYFRDFRPIPEVHHLLHLYSLYVTSEAREERRSYTLASPIHFLRILADIIMILIFSPYRLLKFIFLEASTSSRAPLWLWSYTNSIKWESSRYSKANFPCATELEECGVEFTNIRTWNSLCDVRISRFRGIMQIPRLSMDRDTMALFANLIAYENRKGQQKYLTSFTLLMDNLINSSKDVALLRQHEIIVSDLDDTELADFFNNIRRCRGFHLTYSDYYFRELSYDVAEYCIFKLLKGRVYLKMLKRDYFSNPWALISFLAAIILLGLTIAQTFFTIYPYFHPRS